MNEDEAPHTDDFVFEGLILPDCIAVAIAFVLLSVEVFYGLVVEEAVSMNSTSDLC